MTIDKPYPDHLISSIHELQRICKEMSYDNRNHAKDNSFKQIERLFFQQTAITNTALETAFSLLETDMMLLNHLYSEKGYFAKKEDVEGIKTELTRKVNEKLGPIKEAFEQLKDMQRRGENTDAYG